MRTIHLLHFLSVMARSLGQAPGTNDTSFNPGDYGRAVGDAIPIWSGKPADYYSNYQVTSVAVDGNGRTLCVGTMYAGFTDSFILRHNSDGSLDPTFTASSYAVGTVDAVALQSDGKILIGGSFSCNGLAQGRYNLIRLNDDGSLDESFPVLSSTSWGTGAPRVRAIAVQPDGRILIGGTFTQYNGSSVSNITRLLNTGLRDNSWFSGTLGGTNGPVYAICIQPDSRVLVAGDFTQAGNSPRVRIARFDPTNTISNWVDGSFLPGTGCNAIVRTMALQVDGNILLGGDFTLVSGVVRGRIVRLTSAGSVDGAFATSPGCDGVVRALSIRTDGSIVVGGDFDNCQGVARKRVAVVTLNGSLEMTFDPGIGPNGSVNHVLARSDGKVMLWGGFSSCSGVATLRHVRLTAGGAVDNTYSFNGANNTLTAVAVQNDGGILLGGQFSTFNGYLKDRIVRLLPNGNIDASFVPGVAYESLIEAGIFRLNDMIIQPDGSLIVAGLLRSNMLDMFGSTGHGIARMQVNGALDQSFSATINHLQEVRGLSQQSDGKLIAAHSSYSAFASTSTLKRFKTDGLLDSTFTIGTTTGGLIERTAVQPDGRILVLGAFQDYSGSGRKNILRLNIDGSIDNSFNYVTGFMGGSPKHLLILSDGKVIVSGSFTSYDDNPTNGLCRLNTDGSNDTSFVPTVQGGGPLMLDINGQLILGARYRLNPDGSTDAAFNTGSGFANAYGACTPLAIAESMGNIVAVGDFTAFNGTGRNRIARINNNPYANMSVSVRALLEGPYDANTTFMNDGLRVAGLIPITEPFTALGFTHVTEGPVPPVSPSVFNTTAPAFNSIVDWVMLELRSASSPTTVLQTRTGLVQRDGEVVSLDGVSQLVFNYLPGSYYVAIRPRNHLGCMTGSPLALSTSTTTNVLFSLPSTSTYGIEARKIIGTRAVLWAGDTGHDGSIRYTGAGNDRDPVLQKVGSTPNGSVIGYFTEDVNMDGIVRYTGAANDRDPILVNVGSTTPNNVRAQQIP